MSQPPRIAPAITAGWPDLVDELDRWQQAGRVATLWWRDDDAIAPSVRLDRLMLIAGNVPIALAVIPALAGRDLATWVSRRPRPMPGANLAVLQHGWRHLSRSAGGKKTEFPAERPRNRVASDLAAGRARLASLFGGRALPVLVPPWNRFDDSLLSLFQGCGLFAISRMKPRSAFRPAPGIIEVNVHVDLVAWAGGRGFIGEERALGLLVEHLRARRLGVVCADEPTGILTHHLVQDDATEAFLDRLVAVTSAGAGTRWLDAKEAFAAAMVVPT
jgi:hypothetical protein